MLGLRSIGYVLAAAVPLLLTASLHHSALAIDDEPLGSQIRAELSPIRPIGRAAAATRRARASQDGPAAWYAPLPTRMAIQPAGGRIERSAGRAGAAATIEGWAQRLPSAPAQAAEPACDLPAPSAGGGAAANVPHLATHTAPRSRSVEFEVIAIEIARREIGRLEINWRDKEPRTPMALGLAASVAESYGRERAAAAVVPAARELRRAQSKIERRLQHLERQGNLRTLARRYLHAGDGEPARFDASGNILMPVTRADGTMSVAFEALGVAVELVPHGLGRQPIALELRTEVSSPTRHGAIHLEGFSVPVVTTSRGRAEVLMSGGQTLAVTNLFTPETANNADLFPMLGELPIVGELFQSRRFQRGETELVLLITPELIETTAGPDLVVACAPPTGG
jgi:pilus assembly protein CpaC